MRSFTMAAALLLVSAAATSATAGQFGDFCLCLGHLGLGFFHLCVKIGHETFLFPTCYP